MFGEKNCSFRLKLVDDFPGEHVYIHCCRICNREYGPEFILFHESTGKAKDPAPLVTAPVCTGRQGSVQILERFEAMYSLGVVVANT